MQKALSYFSILLVFISTSFTAVGQNWDAEILRAVNTNRNKSLDKTFIFITDTELPVSVGVPLITLGAGYISKNKELQRKGWENFGSLAIGYAITYSLKRIVDRDRPIAKYSFIDPYKTSTKNSFPSGHSTVAFSTATSLSINFKKWYVVVPAYLWAGAMGYSRLHLGVHYPSDVLAGAIIGSGSAWLSHRANKWLHKKKNKEKPLAYTATF
jgi:membrane-associated phospholipid phosphatase